MMFAMVDGGLLSGFLVESRNHEEMVVSYLLFTDDALISWEPSGEQLRNLRYIFLCFEVVLELKIIMSKLEIVPVGEVVGLASILDCRE
jgi:hypothetical protein